MTPFVKNVLNVFSEYKSEDANWLGDASRAILEIASRVSQGKDFTIHERTAANVLLLHLAAAMRDASEGVQNPFTKPIHSVGRPKADTYNRANRSFLAMVASFELVNGKALKRENEASYRAAATRINRQLAGRGEKVTWRQVRSAWSNRAKYSIKERDALIRTDRLLQDSPELAENLIDAIALMAALPEKSKPPLF